MTDPSPDAAATPPGAAPSRRSALAITTALAAVTVAAYTLHSSQIHNPDCFAYAEAAQGVLDGRVLYRDTWQDKPPLAILFYLLPQLVLRGSYPAMQAALAGLLLIQAWVWNRLLAGEDRTARWATTLFLTFYPLTSIDFCWPSTENLANPFLTVQFALAWRIARRGGFTLAECLAVGAVACLGFNVRQNSLLSAGVPMLAALATGSAFGRKALAVACAAAGFVAAEALLLAAAAPWMDLAGYADTVLRYPRRYAMQSNAVGVVILLWELVRRDLFLMLCVLLPTAALPGMRVVIPAAALAAFAGCVSPLKPYAHYWANLIPVLGLMLTAALSSRAVMTAAARRWAAVGVSAFVVIAALSHVGIGRRHDPRALADAVAAEIHRAAVPGDTLMVLGPSYEATYLHFATRTPPAHTYFWCVQLDPYWNEILPQPIEQINAEYLAAPPRLVAIHRGYLPPADRPRSELNTDRLMFRLLRENGVVHVADSGPWMILRLTPRR